MPHPDLAVVTGAFSYTGKYIARRLLDKGVRVRTLTRHPDHGNTFSGQVEAAPMDFSDSEGLRDTMRGAGVLYNTYWVRFARRQTTFEQAIENTRMLFEAAKEAGVGRIVHLSVTNASHESRLPYFRGKAQVEEILQGLEVTHAIIRPTLVFGVEDILLNNIAWALRRFPVFPIYGSGEYPVQPVYVDDVAALAVEAGSKSHDSTVDAAGPDTYSFEALVRLFVSRMGVHSQLVRMPASVGLALTRLVGVLIRDVVLTRDEVDGLMAGLLVSSRAGSTTATRLGDWLTDTADNLGRRYESELKRNWR